jgi:hypothetical protein
MCVTSTAKRRRRQAKNGNRHLAPMHRPGLPKKISVEKSQRRLHDRIMNEYKIQRKPKKT